MHASTRAGRPYNTDATAAPNRGHPTSIVVTDDISFVADLGNAGRPSAIVNRPRPTVLTNFLRATLRKGLDSRAQTGNATLWGAGLADAQPRASTNQSRAGARDWFGTNR